MNRLFKTVLFLIVISWPAFSFCEAQVSWDTPFSKLFTTSKERAILDSKRDNFYGEFSGPTVNSEPQNKITDKFKNETQTSSEDIVVSGMIIREDGTKVVWINGKQIDNKDNKDKNVTFSSKKSEVIIKELANKKRLQPGQVWNINNNQVIESYLYNDIKPVIDEINDHADDNKDNSANHNTDDKNKSDATFKNPKKSTSPESTSSSLQTLEKVKQANDTVRLLLRDN